MIKFEHPYANVIKLKVADVVATSGGCTEDCDGFSCDNDAGEW